MHKKLAKKLDDIPYLPAKSFFQISGDALEKRKDDLEKYFNVNYFFPTFITMPLDSGIKG